VESEKAPEKKAKAEAVESVVKASINIPTPPDQDPMQPDRSQLRATIRKIMHNNAITTQRNKMVMDAINKVELVSGPAPNDYHGVSINHLSNYKMLEYRLKPFKWPTPELCVNLSAGKGEGGWKNWREKHP